MEGLKLSRKVSVNNVFAWRFVLARSCADTVLSGAQDKARPRQHDPPRDPGSCRASVSGSS